jgi:hypothetical protein
MQTIGTQFSRLINNLRCAGSGISIAISQMFDGETSLWGSLTLKLAHRNVPLGGKRRLHLESGVALR